MNNYDTSNIQSAEQHLLTALTILAPNLQAQRLVASQFNTAKLAGGSFTRLNGLRYLSYAITDGLKSGNWPWVIAGINSKG